MKEPVKFLLVDDLEANLLALEGILKRPGLELLKASSGAAALELLLVHDVALAFLDVQMPEMDGFELAELMRGTERTRQVPIIFLTAGATNDLRRFRGYELGAVDVLFKPIDPHILRSKADVFFELARQRKDLQEAIQRAEIAQQRFQNAARATNDAIWDWNISSGELWWNEGVRSLFGYAAGQVSPRIDWWHERLHPSDRERILSGLHAVLEGGETFWRDEYRFERADGSYAEIFDRGYVIRAAGGQPLRMVGAMQDMTERKRAERALRESEQRLHLAVAATALGTWDYNPATSVLQLDARCREMFGVAPETRVNYPAFLAALHPEDRQPVEQAVQWAFDPRSGGKYDVEFRSSQIHSAEGARWIRATGQAYFEPSLEVWEPAASPVPRVVRFIGTAQDITQRVRARELLEQAVRERTAELHATTEQLETFVYSIAHDLRAPLRAMQGFSHTLVEDYQPLLDENGQKYLQRIQSSAEFMDKLLLDLLAFGQVARAKVELVPVQVQTAWKSALYQCAAQIERSHARVEAALALPAVYAHEATLGQVLANLLSNGLKFARPNVPPQIRFWAQDSGDKVRLWLEDNGIGITADQQERVFRVFERLHGSRYPGTGIGLSIVRKGVERMGGAVGFESEPGRGTRFWIELRKV